MSEGEEFIADFLKSEKIEFKKEVVISSLRGDSKKNRKADFYLPKYKIYIEFFGQWNLEKHKPRYIEKKDVYHTNSIPCIYLYPENLGIIEYIFHKRIITELKKYSLRRELLKYRLDELWKERIESFIYLIFGALILYAYYPWSLEENKSIAIFGGIMVSYQVFKIAQSLNQIFRKGPINKRIF